MGLCQARATDTSHSTPLCAAWLLSKPYSIAMGAALLEYMVESRTVPAIKEAVRARAAA